MMRAAWLSATAASADSTPLESICASSSRRHHVQAPSGAGGPRSVGDPRCGIRRRCHSEFRRPMSPNFSAAGGGRGALVLWRIKGRSRAGLGRRRADTCGSGLERPMARQDHSAAPVPRPRRPSGALPVFVGIARADHRHGTEVETWSVRVSGWNADIAPATVSRIRRDRSRCPIPPSDGAALLVSTKAAPASGDERSKTALIEGRRVRCAQRPPRRQDTQNGLYGSPRKGTAKIKSRRQRD